MTQRNRVWALKVCALHIPSQKRVGNTEVHRDTQSVPTYTQQLRSSGTRENTAEKNSGFSQAAEITHTEKEQNSISTSLIRLTAINSLRA